MPSFNSLLAPKKVNLQYLTSCSSVKKSRLSVFHEDPLDKVLTRTLSLVPFTVHSHLKVVAA